MSDYLPSRGFVDDRQWRLGPAISSPIKRGHHSCPFISPRDGAPTQNTTLQTIKGSAHVPTPGPDCSLSGQTGSRGACGHTQGEGGQPRALTLPLRPLERPALIHWLNSRTQVYTVPSKAGSGASRFAKRVLRRKCFPLCEICNGPRLPNPLLTFAEITITAPVSKAFHRTKLRHHTLVDCLIAPSTVSVMLISQSRKQRPSEVTCRAQSQA